MNEQSPADVQENASANEVSSPSSLAWETTSSDPMRPIEVHVARYVSSPDVLPEDLLARKRAGIWNNESRNRALVDIANAMSSRDLDACWSYGLFLSDADCKIIARLPQPPAVTVLVESAEHANQLSELLPNFTLCTAERNQRRPCTLAALLIGSIVTQVAVRQAYRLRSDAIVNAVGGPHALALANWDLSFNRTTILIDVLDEADDLARGNTWARMVSYHRLASRVIGADSVFGKDPGERHSVPCKDRHQRLSERSNHVASSRLVHRLDRFRSWRGK